VNGTFGSFCDCAKGQKSNQIDTACYHIQLVKEYPDDFGDIIYENEEPPSFSMFDVVGKADRDRLANAVINESLFCLTMGNGRVRLVLQTGKVDFTKDGN
jgi:hypothetical protein